VYIIFYWVVVFNKIKIKIFRTCPSNKQFFLHQLMILDSSFYFSVIDKYVEGGVIYVNINHWRNEVSGWMKKLYCMKDPLTTKFSPLLPMHLLHWFFLTFKIVQSNQGLSIFILIVLGPRKTKSKLQGTLVFSIKKKNYFKFKLKQLKLIKMSIIL